VKRILLLAAVAFAVGLAADLVVGATYPGLTAGLGFVGCGVIVLGSKWLGHSLLQRPEAYYADPDVAEGLEPDGQTSGGPLVADRADPRPDGGPGRG
jgi:hypothetical protein